MLSALAGTVWFSLNNFYFERKGFATGKTGTEELIDD